MNRSAYYTTGFAIKTFASLSKADVIIEGKENIPEGPKIFVVNHFTRAETLLIPYYIYNLTNVPALSLAADVLFKGPLKKYLEMVGAVSTKDPKRDTTIIKGLLTGSENWVIFPEGRMVKSKKIIGDGSFLITHEGGTHKPHTGAASLALRAEFFRRHLLLREHQEPENVVDFLKTFDIESVDLIRDKTTSIVPVNLTYYPIRAKENFASQFATRVLKEVPERAMEELMTEGTMFLSGVDLDIHFGQPIRMEEFLATEVVEQELSRPVGKEPKFSEDLAETMRSHAQEIMMQYMTAIYSMTTVNHDHLFASFLERYPFKKMSEIELRRRVYLVARKISDKNSVHCNLHHSLKEDQVHLLTDDRFNKVKNFLQLAQETNVITMSGDMLVKKERKIPDLVQFHRERIDNPIEVIVNEVEPLAYIQKLVRSVAWQPNFMVKRKVLRSLIEEDLKSYLNDCQSCVETQLHSGGPVLLPGSTRKIGVVLIHSYLSVPEEMAALARHLNRKGLWVYIVRLAGHGTTSGDLAQKTYTDWQYSVERGYAILSTICRNVVLGGMSIGGCLALDLASRLAQLSGVFAICPPLRLKDYSTSFMPSLDVWKRIVGKLKRNSLDVEDFPFSSENRFINYDRNPVVGIRNVGLFLEHLRGQLEKIVHPTLIVHAENDPIVDSRGSKKIYDGLGTSRKEYILLASNKHIITSGEGSSRVHKIVSNFINEGMS